MSDCLFCKMVKGEVPTHKLYEDDNCFVIKDIRPKADTHLLVITKKHIESLQALTSHDATLMSDIVMKLNDIAKAQGLTNFRTIVNSGEGSGQEIFHLHFHLLSGKNLPGF